jgi:FMN-dependent oxidoreductase (nitrilotriacetate monooxygenase family)
MAQRSMSLVGFMQAGSTTVYAGSWRHPATEHGFLDPGYYTKLGRILEQGCFDMMFFDDRLAMPGIYGGSVAEAVRVGARPVKLDLSIVLGLIAGATEHIGLGATYSTTYYSPFHVARTFATLDHLSGGRAAWNVVTSVNDSEAQNFGLEEHLGHDDRYDRADEFLEATTGLWDTWDDAALILDRENGLFADPDKVHELGYRGKWYSVRGPLTVPRSPQGRPVLLQAGSSGRGRDFAARWAELIFTGDPGLDIARSHYKDQKERIGELGRDPEQVKMLPMAYTVVGESRAHAEEREELFLNHLVDPLASLTLLSELMNYDFSSMSLDDEITDELVESVSGIRGLVQNLRAHIGETVTLRDLAGHRATLLQGPRFVGTGPEVADQMHEWFESGACDGFVIAATHSPGAYEDVVRLVVPHLQRRGVFRDRYTGQTLRDTLGLPRPSATGG